MHQLNRHKENHLDLVFVNLEGDGNMLIESYNQLQSYHPEHQNNIVFQRLCISYG